VSKLDSKRSLEMIVVTFYMSLGTVELFYLFLLSRYQQKMIRASNLFFEGFKLFT
jgi:hypothetical protein